MRLPTDVEIQALHRKHAPTEEAFQLVYTHCKIVSEIAEQIIHSVPDIDRELVRAGCLLHDIGVYRLYRDGVLDEQNYICHGILGHELLHNEGFEEPLCRFASHHTGVGLTKEQIIKRNLPLPHKDFLAENDEELLVMYADKFHSKSIPPRFNNPEFYKDYVSKFGQENVFQFQAMIDRFGAPNLEKLSRTYGHIIV